MSNLNTEFGSKIENSQEWNEELALTECLKFLDNNDMNIPSNVNKVLYELELHNGSDFTELIFMELEQRNINKDVVDKIEKPEHPLNLGYPNSDVEAEDDGVMIYVDDLHKLLNVPNFSTVIAGGIVRNLHTLYEIQYPIQKNNIFKPRHLNQEVYKEKFSSFDIQNLCNFINSRLTNNEIAKIESSRPELNKELYFSIPIHTRDEAYEYALNRAGLVYDRNFNWSTKYLKVTLINNAFHFSTNYIEYFYQYLNQIGMPLARVPNDDTPMYLLFLEEETLDGFIDWIWGELGGQ